MMPRRYGPLAYLPITRRPKLTWPGGARVALWVNPNIEFFGLDDVMPGIANGQADDLLQKVQSIHELAESFNKRSATLMEEGRRTLVDVGLAANRMSVKFGAAGEAVAAGKSSLFALAVVVGVAVLREGAEVVLFLYGILATESSEASVFLGGMIGLALGALTCALTYFGLLRIPGRYLFAATSLMIAFLAAGMASQAVAFLAQADVLTALGSIVWDSSWLLSDSSIPGRALHTLIGYSDRPTEMQLLVYAATLAVTFLLMRLFAPVPKAAHAH